MAKRILQTIGVGVSVAAGIATGILAKTGPGSLPPIAGIHEGWPWGIVVGAGTLVSLAILSAIISWIVKQIRQARIGDLLAAAAGLLIGLLLAGLATFPLSQIRFAGLNQWLPVLSAILFGYLGVAVALLKRDEITRSITNIFHRRQSRDGAEHDEADGTEERPTRGKRGKVAVVAEKQQEKVLLDTSAIIDGRIAEISGTGFIMGTLVVPRFVLEELQRIADSADTLRRNRGRRGLDILNRLKNESTIPVEVTDTDFETIHEVDAKLVKMAKLIHAPIITNDFNLNKVAELQGVKVLNINELANAVKPALLPGEDMFVKIIQEGKELGQGVGYLDDGTMIVVENGKSYMNAELEVTVTRVLQTAAGRMIFAHPKAASGAMRRTS